MKSRGWIYDEGGVATRGSVQRGNLIGQSSEGRSYSVDVFTAVEPKVMPFHGGCGSSGDVIDMGPRGAKVSLLSRGRGSIVRGGQGLNIQKLGT